MSKLYVNEVYSKTGSTKALEIDSSGRVTQPEVPAIFVQGNNSTSSTVTAYNVLTPANFTTSYYGAFAQGGMSYNTSNGEITVPIDGVYKIYGQFYINAGVQVGRISININGSPRALGHRDDNESYGTVHTDLVIKLNANDKITFTSDYTTTIYFGNRHTFYTAYLVG